MKKCFAMVILITAVTALFGDSTPIPVPEPRTEDLVLAAILSSSIGFGTGHLVLEAEKSDIFSYGELAAVVVAAAGAGIQLMVSNDRYGEMQEAGRYLGMGMMFSGATVYTGLRIWETVDLIQFLLKKR